MSFAGTHIRLQTLQIKSRLLLDQLHYTNRTIIHFSWITYLALGPHTNKLAQSWSLPLLSCGLALLLVVSRYLYCVYKPMMGKDCTSCFGAVKKEFSLAMTGVHMSTALGTSLGLFQRNQSCQFTHTHKVSTVTASSRQSARSNPICTNWPKVTQPPPPPARSASRQISSVI